MRLNDAHRQAVARWGTRGIAIEETIATAAGTFTLHRVGIEGPDDFSVTIRGSGRDWAEAFRQADQGERGERLQRRPLP